MAVAGLPFGSVSLGRAAAIKLSASVYEPKPVFIAKGLIVTRYVPGANPSALMVVVAPLKLSWHDLRTIAQLRLARQVCLLT